ncbi:sulfotransferase 1C4-like [Leptidea sinapis]|uniref:sulfotransferase 1C4-like n=1 Tax=Leptidea sinapis TaxID=189913 RepID=UPI00213EE4B5|nr:sulfotransferase 1C4-like [Leptidea sinapis]
MEASNFPYDVTDVESQVSNEIFKAIKPLPLVYVGPKRYIFPEMYKEWGPQFYNMEIRPDDIFLVGFPRSGTTLCQEIIWLLNNNLDYKKAKSIPVGERVPLMDFSLVAFGGETFKNNNSPVLQKLEPYVHKLRTAPSPRFIKSHLPLSLLPPKLLDNNKVVYIARDPRDAAVSLYHLMELKYLKQGTSFKEFWNNFIAGRCVMCPVQSHIREGWEKRNNPNLLFLSYNELTRDFPSTLKRMATFFNKEYTNDQIDELCGHLSFDNFKNNESVNRSSTYHKLGYVNNENPFIRKGKAGGWREYFDDEMTKEADRWISEHFADIGLGIDPK